MTSINAIVANEHRADLLRAAAQQRLGAELDHANTSDPTQTIALRLAQPDEARDVARLAALDDAPRPDGQVLLALVDGRAVAALSLRDGRVVANPFEFTEDAVALLRLRHKHLGAGVSSRRWGGLGRPRFTRRDLGRPNPVT
jgi:hypothetical protein